MTLETATDAYEDDSALDIYEVLGVSRDVSPVMAQTMYWARVSELRRDEARGDLEARRLINQLNIALQIILDPERRTQYEDYGVITSDVDAPELEPREPSQFRRAGLRGGIAVLPGVAAGLLSLLLTGEPIVAVIVAVAPVLAAALISTTTEAVESSKPLDVLELREGATLDQIDLAYRTLVGLWLARVGASPDQAVHELDRLDRAYADALERALDTREKEERRQAGTGRWLGGVAAATGRQGLRATVAGGRMLGGGARWVLRRPVGRASRQAAGGVARTVGPASTKTAGRLQRAVGRGAEATARAASDVAGSVTGSVAGGAHRVGEELAALEHKEATAEGSLTVDIERRLRANIHAVAQQAVEPAPEAPDESLDDTRVRLVLDSAVGPRRIPVQDRPIRIGPGKDADIMVDAGDATDVDDTLIWVSGGELVLHATPGALVCLVNGEPVTWARLDHDDAVTIGHTSFRVESDLDEA